ncbi:MAG: hypothetical protein KIT36_06585 [Alphaproteobacteria bacterium]|nr:hypothetical protein [Alphaproteobacteria bacterium]
MGGLFGGAPRPPSPPPPAPDPDKESPLAKEAERRRRARIAQRGGRASTVLTDALGGGAGDYGGTDLGG